MNAQFLNLDEDVMFKYMDIAKKTLSKNCTLAEILSDSSTVENEAANNKPGDWRPSRVMLQRQTSSGTTFGYGKSSGMSVQDSFSMKDYDAVKDVINNMPTAYDVDKVVEQLEKRIQTHERCIEYEKKNGTITEEFQQRKAVEVLKEAIEIVKGGGVDAKTDS